MSNTPDEHYVIAVPPRSGMSSLAKITLGLLLIVVLFVASYAWNYFGPTPMWEYTLVDIPDTEFKPQMDSLGQQGWELVFARRASAEDIRPGEKPKMMYELIFKRPKRFR